MSARHLWRREDEMTIEAMTFHRFHFGEARKAREWRPAAPQTAAHWLCGPARPVGISKLINGVSPIWFGLGFYRDLSEAEKILVAHADHLPDCAQAKEAWHALLIPISHKGETNWFGEIASTSIIRPVATDPGGPLVVLTSAGYQVLPPEQLTLDLPRRLDFIANVDRVLEWFASVPGNLARENYEVGKPTTDGLTFSLWESDSDMMRAAYQAGPHRTQLERLRTERIADRTSFTRARVARRIGTWQGSPLI